MATGTRVKNIAVVGAGIYGTTAAIALARSGFSVDLFERERDILQAASGINQYRLHRGYHYPRSAETGSSSRGAVPTFLREYGDAVSDKNKHYYCIAREKSRVSGERFLNFCGESGLEHRTADLPHVRGEAIEVAIEGREFLVDPAKLRSIVRGRLTDVRVRLALGREVGAKDIRGYDAVVNCAYANLNAILEDHPEARRAYQFELCEKPVLKLPEHFRGVSIVVMDGPFFCIDPYADTDLHVMGNVVHAIHASNTGLFPIIPKEYVSVLNRGIVKNPRVTTINKFIEAAAHFMPDIRRAEHVGSMYTIRTVLPNVDSTDARPTIVSRTRGNIINVFSGKLGNSVQAAEEVARIVSDPALADVREA
ncbi:MAG: hypothetical protein A3I44_05980 [Candidatus Sungbacteria bacterium RIFCSPLOWO2_02_FULL_51_17]|uniref:FAD dependent oxidoreductase domain-containing protein n=1 Tax=Candidatus Sungbacteria bacterium RIFCSPHIGHO2_02_FULL_51_29 TaxID=1802273 RepID=A0A1G2KR68_9BACT|nr:MAG: hypothetical protein A2676_01505 [Candidatus Sungbacteria bacterium RIFCSPHIGHO2_01_FULL_51_22]OHA01880.1 MAG: hypothetical protein A3C16_03240 [Candidatus Sungbacteria bacterium RIFCSPHIGHO2_02_FULL_51_29]OHA07499.1 MAG: hypothetical protein A3B29_02295 [Candidatus Sungbacteria bacterium RIFCSPLOWO2_01_FULL_51_34]OHA12398.1 MAG: hypothetical protein A3I44_05980 [Candidatus Sungbacteria bacterium RIFCSPLOWO2_02_FULL_51_17]